MQVTVTTLMGDVFSLEVPEDLELENFKAFCEAESGVPAKEMVIMFNGAVLKDDKKPLKEYGVKNGDMIVMEKLKKQAAVASSLPGGGLKMPDFGKIRMPGQGMESFAIFGGPLKVSKSLKQFMMSSILPKNERDSLS